MITVRQTPEFAEWVARLTDIRARALIAARIDRLAFGHRGDVKAVGDGIQELRIHHGPGYRLYFTQREGRLILLLCGGDKSTQTRDILRAKRLAANVEE